MSRERSSSRRFYRGESYSNLQACMDRGMAAEEENRWTFEIAWEAANKGNISIYINEHVCFIHECKNSPLPH